MTSQALTVTLSPDETHHLIRVLRMTPGDEAFVFDGCGREYRCVFRAVQEDRARLDVQHELDESVESPLRLTLAQGLAKGEKFDFIVQKATELGVASIAPLITRYSEVRFAEQPAAKRLERWRRISLEVSEAMRPPQARRDRGSSYSFRVSRRRNRILRSKAARVQRKRRRASRAGARRDFNVIGDNCDNRAGRRMERSRTRAIEAIQQHLGHAGPASSSHRNRRDRGFDIDSTSRGRLVGLRQRVANATHFYDQAIETLTREKLRELQNERLRALIDRDRRQSVLSGKSAKGGDLNSRRSNAPKTSARCRSQPSRNSSPNKSSTRHSEDCSPIRLRTIVTFIRRRARPAARSRSSTPPRVGTGGSAAGVTCIARQA